MVIQKALTLGKDLNFYPHSYLPIKLVEDFKHKNCPLLTNPSFSDNISFLLDKCDQCLIHEVQPEYWKNELDFIYPFKEWMISAKPHCLARIRGTIKFDF